MRILLVEDQTDTADYILKALREAGHAADHARDGKDGLFLATTENYDAIILDRMLPKVDGLTVLRELRARQDTTPVIVLTARDGPRDRVTGLDSGADDYLVKPFETVELLARMRALLRRQAGHARSLIGTDALTLDLATHELSFRGVAEILPAREFALMRALLERPGQILSRGQLEDRIYGWGSEIESNAIDVLIHYVRRKFGAEVIRNVRGVGWLVTR